MHNKIFTQSDLKKIYNQHQKWLKNKEKGKQACYSNVSFENLDFSNMNFKDAVFENCSFKYSDLTKTSFQNANLSFSDFSESKHILENCFIGSNLLGCNFGNINLFEKNNIERYEEQYIKYQKIYIGSFIFSMIFFFFPKFLIEILSISFMGITINLTQNNISFIIIISSFISCIMSFYFLKLNAKNITDQFKQLPSIFPKGTKREDIINNSFIKSIFDVQNCNCLNKKQSDLEYDLTIYKKAGICIEHNIVYFSYSIFFMEILGLIDKNDDCFFYPLIILPLSFSNYKNNIPNFFSFLASISCLCFFKHNYLIASILLLASFCFYPIGAFYSRIILFLYAIFVLGTVYTHSLFPSENLSLQEFNGTCDIKKYKIYKIYGKNLDNMNLKNLKAVSIDFSNKSFNNSELTNADLRCSSFKNTSFNNAILDNVDFRGANIDIKSLCLAKSYKHIKTDKTISCVKVPILK